MISSEFLIGSDPEFAGFSRKENKFKSLIGLFGGTKTKPLAIDVKGCAVQEDGVNVEFTVPPCRDFYTLHDIIDDCINWANSKIKSKDLIIVPKSSAIYDPSELEKTEANVFGCDPSMCVYTDSQTDIPPAEVVGFLRCSGFHLHFGFPETYSKEEYYNFIKLCDAFLGIPSLIHEKDTGRREIYGSLGDFRYQKWGIEYRTMGSEMFTHPYHVAYGINAISKVLKLNVVEEFVNKIEPLLYITYNEKNNQYKSKKKIWQEIQTEYSSLIQTTL